MNGSGHKLSVKEKLAYSLGGVASSLLWTPFTMFSFSFYTGVVGLAPAVAGTMMLVSRIWDPAIGPVMGAIADRTETRWGKFRPYLLLMAPACGILGALAFIAPHFAPAGKLVYAYVTYMLAALVISAISAPYGALMGVISPDSQERTSVCSYQYTVVFGGGLIAQFAMRKLPKFFEGGFSLGYPTAMLMLAALAVLLFFGCFAGTKERVKPPKNQKTALRKDLGDLLRNVPWWILAGTGLFTLIAFSLRGASMVISNTT